MILFMSFILFFLSCNILSKTANCPKSTIEVSNEVNSEELMVVDAESNDEDFTNESTNEPDDEGENWFE